MKISSHPSVYRDKQHKIPTTLKPTLCLELISKGWHGNMVDIQLVNSLADGRT